MSDGGFEAAYQDEAAADYARERDEERRFDRAREDERDAMHKYDDDVMAERVELRRQRDEWRAAYDTALAGERELQRAFDTALARERQLREALEIAKTCMANVQCSGGVPDYVHRNIDSYFADIRAALAGTGETAEGDA